MPVRTLGQLQCSRGKSRLNSRYPLPGWRLLGYDVTMSKDAKKGIDAVRRNAGSGEFVVAKPAVGPKRFTLRQIRDAVRSVKKSQAAKAK